MATSDEIREAVRIIREDRLFRGIGELRSRPVSSGGYDPEQVREAARIIREDRIYAAVHGGTRVPPDPAESDPKVPPRKKQPDKPPKGKRPDPDTPSPAPDDEPKPRRGGWWGDRLDDDSGDDGADPAD